jgi:hypothetical protein
VPGRGSILPVSRGPKGSGMSEPATVGPNQPNMAIFGRHPGARAAVRGNREGPGRGGPALSERGPGRTPSAGGQHRPAPPVRRARVVRPKCSPAASSSPGTARAVPVAPHPSGSQGYRCPGDAGTPGPSVTSVRLFHDFKPTASGVRPRRSTNRTAFGPHNLRPTIPVSV